MGAEPLMAGNSQRRGRSDGAGKKRATAGTGGKNRRSLAGRGATPPAEARPGHPAQRRAAAEQRQRADRARARAKSEEQPELLLGRNPVVEALRARIPANALYVVTGDNQRGTDERIAEALALAADRGCRCWRWARPSSTGCRRARCTRASACRCRPTTTPTPTTWSTWPPTPAGRR
ncbi:hypothetical protein [Blastococcus brunescens]|uniref:RNA 2-O ribose methyltransferase substrate binding domain-containing protein n=1 Tax=Blastococcus brunescens TaxID=1564165 RepID=A0ABZ1B3Y0_9ACTN|nr:hypothetical protein [Blastococcus sp. BMG 8361]WRL64563.1 hypothetical protein U6N30_01765 [Blastococcus sp. BMG 8361]